MERILRFFSKITRRKEELAQEPTTDWYYDRYNKLSLQRNILFISTIACFIVLTIALITVIYVSNARKFEPFIIQVEEKTGITKVVVPMDSKVLSAQDELAKYLIKRYITARETYNPVDYSTMAKKVLKLMSSNEVYRQYKGFIRGKDSDPSIVYADNNSTYLNIRSWSKLENNKYIVRFSVHETAQQMRVFNKIAVVEIAYVAMQLSEDDLDINPVGFQVIGYRVDNDNS